ncbi:MAG: hypothetical protein HQL53_06110 [Magnetococcales bacterium]|nr:hypothetical protein [Magnetococcales bacterium]
MNEKAPSSLFNWVDHISWTFLLVAAVWLTIAPYPIAPEPHLLEKLRMLSEGTLTKPLDIFDLLWHSAAWVIVGIKWTRKRRYDMSNDEL